MEPVVDIEAEPGQHDTDLPAKVLAILLSGLLVLSLFQSAALVTLAYDLPPGGSSETIVALAETWHGWVSAAGFAGVTEWVSEMVLAIHGVVAG